MGRRRNPRAALARWQCEFPRIEAVQRVQRVLGQVSAPNQAQDRRRAAQRLFPTINAVQRMDLVEAEMKQDLLDLDRQAQALKAFYATLSPEQQRVFDKRTLPPAQNQQGG